MPQCKQYPAKDSVLIKVETMQGVFLHSCVPVLQNVMCCDISFPQYSLPVQTLSEGRNSGRGPGKGLDKTCLLNTE